VLSTSAFQCATTKFDGVCDFLFLSDVWLRNSSANRVNNINSLEVYHEIRWNLIFITLPVRYGLSLLLLEVYCTPGMDDMCRHVQRQLPRNEVARFYHYRARKRLPPRKLRRDIQ